MFRILRIYSYLGEYKYMLVTIRLMKILLIIMVCLNIFAVHAQESDGDLCEYGKKQALIDFSEGKYVYPNYIGLTSIEKDYDFEKYYQLYLESEFNIKTTTIGCVTFPGELCHLIAMDSLLGKKFNSGKSFFEVNRKSQKQKYYKLSTKEKAKVLNDKRLYDAKFLDKFPEFRGSKVKLRQYFKDYFNMEHYENSFGVKLSVDKLGNVQSVEVFWPEILKDKRITEKAKVIKELNALGKWKSGKIYNRNVNSVFIMRI